MLFLAVSAVKALDHCYSDSRVAEPLVLASDSLMAIL